MAARRRRRKAPKRRTAKRHTSPLGNLAKKVQGINSRVNGIEAELGTIPKRFVRRKRKKTRRLGSLEASGYSHWTSGE
jgi:hypothetical protein